MKQILAVIAALCMLTMTACSSKKNTMDSKVDKPPGTADETKLTDILQETDTEYNPLPVTEQTHSTETSKVTTEVTNEPVTTEAITVFVETASPIISAPPISPETNAAQKPTDKPAVTTKSPPSAPPPDTTTTVKAETNIVTETVPTPHLSIEDIKAMCVRTAQSMGYTQNTTLTPENSAWWNPVTVSLKDTRQSVEKVVTEYIRFHTSDNLNAYGLGEIACFNIYAEKQEEGVYRIYFLFA